MLRRVKSSVESFLLNLVGTQEYLTIQLDITNACNLKCAHCYHSHHLNNGALNLDQWIKVIDQYEGLLKTLRLKPSVVFCGGEPLISPLLKPLIREMATRWGNFPYSVLTNGVVVTEDWLSFFKEVPPDSLQVSLDGPDAERHDLIRGRGNFDKALDGIAKLQGVGVSVHTLSILSKKTSAWLEDFFKLGKERGLSQVCFTRLVAQGAGSDLVTKGGDRPLHPQELKQAFTDILHLSKKYGVLTSDHLPLFHLIDPKKGQHAKWGFQSIIVGYQGQMKVSSRVNHVIGNVLTDGLENLFLNHPIMKSLRDGDIEVCGTCPYYRRCGGDRNAAFVAFGNFTAPDPGCWLAAGQGRVDEN